MKLAALVSGGKDSVYAMYLAKKQGHEIKYLLSMIPETNESYMFHHPNAALTALQAETMGIQILTGRTAGEKERELDDLEKLISRIKDDVDGIVAGAVASKYQAERVKKICSSMGLELMTPLWQRDPEEVAKEMIKSGFEIIITAVSAPPMDKGWLGRKYDELCIIDMVKLNKSCGIHILFEGGEGETLVLWCPMFKKRIKILDSVEHWDNKTLSGWLEIKKSELADI